ncbi:MAG TPA: GNAT family N-acetyltransferase [Longimicrobium sp.]|nr:GNAT family N-acetyltransferase [Longimicrobium sp.]
MKFLLDTNVLIPLEPVNDGTEAVLAEDAAQLHSLAVRHGHQVFIHPAVHRDIARDPQQERKALFEQQVRKYPRLLDPPSASDAFIQMVGRPAVGTNDWVDDQLLVALHSNAVDYLVTEDQRIHRKARRLGIEERVARVAEAIRLISDFADETPPPPPLVSAVPAYRLNAADPIFDSFRGDYPGFNSWLEKCQRQHRQSWMIEGPGGQLAAVVIVNPETEPPPPATGRVLKICTRKVAEEAFGFRYGELLLKAVFDYAVRNGYEWLYVTTFQKQTHLTQLFEEFGFSLADAQTSLGELQFVKPVGKTRDEGLELGPLEFHIRYGPPWVRLEGVPWYVIPILPQFSNLLFPETEDQLRFADPRPYGNAIRKAYLSHANVRDIEPGALLWFYRSEVDQGLVALGVAERAVRSTNPDEIARSVGKRTVYSLEQIRDLCNKEVLAVLFRQARSIQPPIPTAELVRHGVFAQPPQSITRIKPEGQAWLRNQLQL